MEKSFNHASVGMVPPFFNLCTVCTAAKVEEDQPPHRKLHTIFLQLELDTPRK